MPNCVKCNASIPDNSKFCNICGAKQEICCPACGAVLPEGSRFCNFCGAPVGAARKPAAAARPFSKSWADFMNRGEIVGNDKYHFVYDRDSYFNNIYRIDTSGTVTKVPNVPHGYISDSNYPLAWAEDKLWYAVTEDNYYALYVLDPEELVWTQEAKFDKESKSEISLPYVTPDCLWFTAGYSYGGGRTVLVLNRKTWKDGSVEAGRVDEMGGDDIAAVGEKEIVVKYGSNCYFMNWWQRGNKVSDDPNIQPMLSVMAQLAGVKYSAKNKDEFAQKHILYVDVDDKKVYFTCNAEEPFKGKGYCLPYGATDAAQAELFWAGAEDMKNAMNCNWQYCVGSNNEAGSRHDLVVKTADGATVPLGRHRILSSFSAFHGADLVNNMVYVEFNRGRYIIDPIAKTAQFQKIELE